MSSFSFDFVVSDHDKTRSTIDFERCLLDEEDHDKAKLDHKWDIKEIEALSRSDNGVSVLRCEWHGGPFQTVIAKLGIRDRAFDAVREEAERYVWYLEEAQGKVVPRFLGFYETEDGEGDSVACMLLEDCGRRLTEKEWNSNINNIVAGVCMTLATFHQLTKCDYGEILYEHIVTDGRGDGIRLVSFKDLEEHDCRFSGAVGITDFGNIIHRKLPDPGPKLIGCDEIHKFCVGYDLVIPSKLSILGSPVPITSDIQNFDDVCRRAIHMFPRKSETFIQEHLWPQWLKIEDQMEKYALVEWTRVDESTNMKELLNEI